MKNFNKANRPMICQTLAAACLALSVPASVRAATLPQPDHVVVVVEENRAFSNIIGYSGAPYINGLAAQGALMLNSYGTDGASQPNYLQLFSGDNQGVADNTTPSSPFTTPNLRSALNAKGFTFTGYSESLPSVGYTGDSYSASGLNEYVRKHNPWINWIGAADNAVPSDEAQPFTSFPTNFSLLPDVSFVIPNEQNNMHDGGRAAGDLWLQQNLDSYLQWAQANNSLLILTWDEDDGNHGNHITTLFVGPMIVSGQYDQTINHLNVLRTLEDIYGLDYIGNTAGVDPIAGIFVVPEPSPLLLMVAGGFFPLLVSYIKLHNIPLFLNVT